MLSWLVGVENRSFKDQMLEKPQVNQYFIKQQLEQLGGPV